jgi:hypothetical protein
MDNRKDADRKVEVLDEAGEERKARKRHRGVGREGLSATDHVEPAGDAQGLGREGAVSQAFSKGVPAETGGIVDKIPNWLKSLLEMENELRNPARKGLILRKDEASEHLAQARLHLEKAFNEAGTGNCEGAADAYAQGRRGVGRVVRTTSVPGRLAGDGIPVARGRFQETARSDPSTNGWMSYRGGTAK